MAKVGVSHWRKLDNAAKIFPATSGKSDTRVFRFYCVLKEMVNEDILQEALDITMEQFPMFLTVLRKGLFWYYMETSEQKPRVRQERRLPCSTIYVQDKKELLFKVTYFENRINFEVFHALTDGTGATWFMRELVKNYLCLAHQLEMVPLGEMNSTEHDRMDDSFSKYYSKHTLQEKDRKFKSYQIHGTPTEYGELQITEARLSVKEVLAKSRSYGVSMTVFMTAVYLWAIHKEMSALQERRPVTLMIPVNLRNYFPSQTALNFFGWIEVGYKFERGKTTFQDVVTHVKEEFARELTPEKVESRMNRLMALEQNPVLRLAPLTLKDFIMQMSVKLSGHDLTAVYSNMSRITMPQEYQPYIEYFGVYTSTQKMELCMCSYEDELVLGFTSRKESTNIERNFLQTLEEMDIGKKGDTLGYPQPEKPNYMGAKVFQWWSFLTIACCIMIAMFDFVQGVNFPWLKYVLGGLVSMYVALAIGYFKRYNWLKNAIWQLGAVSVVCLLWDLAIGWRGWSVDFVLPGATLVILIAMVVITLVQKLKPQEYMIYYVLNAGYGLLPLILVWLGVVRYRLPSVICSTVCLIFLAAQCIFKRKDFFREMQKKFHV